MDFEIFGWKKAKTDGELARSIQLSVRMHGREAGRGGHRYRLSHLKNLWHVDDIHAVVNHTDDPSWQYWRNTAKGWILVDWRMTRREAQALAEFPLPVEEATEPAAQRPGWHVYAGFDLPYTMDVPCRSELIADEIEEVFQLLGCETSKRQVSVSLPEVKLS